mmetsp:Transcript_1399/g.3012  ORF Transcript_1399/g.3012 Transcript_1399/m.3012 type:complete len:222 (+) Transcript_1399:649-1314(+)
MRGHNLGRCALPLPAIPVILHSLSPDHMARNIAGKRVIEVRCPMFFAHTPKPAYSPRFPLPKRGKSLAGTTFNLEGCSFTRSVPSVAADFKDSHHTGPLPYPASDSKSCRCTRSPPTAAIDLEDFYHSVSCHSAITLYSKNCHHIRSQWGSNLELHQQTLEDHLPATSSNLIAAKLQPQHQTQRTAVELMLQHQTQRIAAKLLPQHQIQRIAAKLLPQHQI